MKILYLVPHVPHPTKVRSYFQIRGLQMAGHEITVVTVARSDADVRNIEQLQQNGIPVIWVPIPLVQAVANSIHALLLGLPMQARFVWSPHLFKKIQDYLATYKPDIVHVEHLRMAVYGLRLMSDWPVVWDAVDHLASLYQHASQTSNSLIWRLISKIEAPLLKKYESALVKRFPATLVISKHDQALFQADTTFPDRVFYAPIGLPLDEPKSTSDRDDATLIITGNLNYHPNVASVLFFVNQIFPLILKQRPDVRLLLVGANPTPAILKLASTNITVTGFVPSLLEELQKATVAVAPITYGSGIKIKVIEAFQSETPLVATSVAVQGLDVRDKEEVLIANDPAKFTNAVISLLEDKLFRDQIGHNGYKYVQLHHNLIATTTQLESFYRQIKSM